MKTTVGVQDFMIKIRYIAFEIDKCASLSVSGNERASERGVRCGVCGVRCAG